MEIFSLHDKLAYLLQFAFSHISGRVGLVETLGEALNGHNTVCISEKRQFIEVLFGPLFRLIRRDQSDQHGMLYVRFNLYQKTVCYLHKSLRVQRYTKKMICANFREDICQKRQKMGLKK